MQFHLTDMEEKMGSCT